MELNGINSAIYTASYQTSSVKSSSYSSTTTTDSVEEEAAVYEKSTTQTSATYTASGKSSKVDQATIDQLKADAEARTSQLASLVEKLLTKQGTTYKVSSLSDLVTSVAATADADTIAQAKEDVSDDGYWGVEQTAERIVSFAKALCGGDSSKVEEMRSAIEKGYEQATGSWGDTLPEISSKTYDRINEMLDEWADESTN